VVRQRRIRSCDVVVLQSTEKKCTKNYNKGEQIALLISILFSDVPVAIAIEVVDFLNSLISLAFGTATALALS